jgi:hypothetical protein
MIARWDKELTRWHGALHGGAGGSRTSVAAGDQHGIWTMD